MKIRKDVFQVTSGGITDDGTKKEPEQQTVVRTIQTDAGTSVTSGGAEAGKMASSIVVEAPVTEVVAAMSHPCGTCKHFDQRAWLEFFRKADDPSAPMHLRETANEVRAALLATYNADMDPGSIGPDGDTDVEHAIKTLGFCQALSDVLKEPIAVHPMSTCPDDVKGPTQPHGFYKPKSREAEKSTKLTYDAFMQTAAGKINTP